METKIDIRASPEVLKKFKTDWRAKKRYDHLIKSMNTPSSQKPRRSWRDGEDPRDKTRY